MQIKWEINIWTENSTDKHKYKYNTCRQGWRSQMVI